MNAFEIVKSAYPGIPDAILNEYAELLPIVAQRGELYENLKRKYYDAVNLVIQWVNGYDARRNLVSVQLLNPSNEQFKTKKMFLWRALPSQNYFFFEIPVELVYDSRLYNGLINNPALMPIEKTLSLDIVNFEALKSVIALYENGASFSEINYGKAYALQTYLNAYKKFSTEIDSERAYLQREAEAQLASYRQDYTDRAQREKSDLQSKKIQMLMAIDNDTKAATRDFQNMLLNAQNLKQNLRGQIG